MRAISASLRTMDSGLTSRRQTAYPPLRYASHSPGARASNQPRSASTPPARRASARWSGATISVPSSST